MLSVLAATFALQAPAQNATVIGRGVIAIKIASKCGLTPAATDK
jgi:hypothetical protein